MCIRGRVLDRKGNLELGAELVVNGNFATDTAWTKLTGWSIPGGSAVATNANGTAIYQVVAPSAGGYIEITFTVIACSAGAFAAVGNAVIGTPRTAPGTYTERLVSNGPAVGVITVGNTSGSITDVSIKLVPGIHLSQATSTSRPVASARKNLLVGTDALATQSVTVIAAQCVLSFTGTGTVTLSGVSTAGPLIGTGAADRVSLTFTPTAGSLTLTVSGSVTLAQLEYRA